MFKGVCVVVVVFKGREFIIYCCLKYCVNIYVYMMCSLSTKIRRCMDIRYITVWMSILQCINDNTKNVTCIFFPTWLSIKVYSKRKCRSLLVVLCSNFKVS